LGDAAGDALRYRIREVLRQRPGRISMRHYGAAKLPDVWITIWVIYVVIINHERNYWFVLLTMPFIVCWKSIFIPWQVSNACYDVIYGNFTFVESPVILENLGIFEWSFRFQQLFNHRNRFFTPERLLFSITLVRFTVHNFFLVLFIWLSKLLPT
jgi:hypothetical protein